MFICLTILKIICSLDCYISLVVIKHLFTMLLPIPTLVVYTLLLTSFAAEANECYQKGVTWSDEYIIDTFYLDLRQCTQARYIYQDSKTLQSIKHV